MNFEEIVEKARSECRWATNRQCTKVYVAGASDSGAADAFTDLFENWAKRTDEKGKVIRTGSFGYYDLEPIVVTEKPEEPAILYHRVTGETASQLATDCLKKAGRRPDLAFCSMGDEALEAIPRASDVPLLALQNRIVLRNCGLVDPQSLYHYVAARHGYGGLAKALRSDRKGVLREIRDAGLGDRGRRAADTWQLFLDAPAHSGGSASGRVIVCNAIDADGRGRTARLLLDSDPHTVLEGLLIAAYALGASASILCIAQEEEATRERLIKLVRRMGEYSLLGAKILDSSFGCDIEIRTAPRSLVLLDDSALLCALEGKQAMPDSRYAYPAGRLEEKRALVCDAETLASLPAILDNGGSWFSGFGTASCTGTRVITLTGDVSHLYTVEVPFGTAIKNIINHIGGGAPGSGIIKTARLGPPFAAFLSQDELASAIDCGPALGGLDTASGVLEVISGENCGVEMAKKVISFLQGESCGKCVFCREGTLQMSEALKDIAQGDGRPEGLNLMTGLAGAMAEGCLCDLGRNAGRPVVSSINLFQSDYGAHIEQKRCPKNP